MCIKMNYKSIVSVSRIISHTTYQLYIWLIKHITGHILLWSVVLTYDHTYVLSSKLKGDFVWCGSLIKVSFSINPFLTDSCVHLNTARYVLSCSKYFEQLKTPCPCRRLSFPPKSENPPNLRCCFYDLDESVLFFNHSLAASVSLYFCFGCFGCSGYCSSIAPSSNAGRK